MSLEDALGEDEYEIPEYEETLDAVAEHRPGATELSLDRDDLTGHEYPISSEDRRRLKGGKKSPVLFFAFMVMALAAIVALALLVLRTIGGESLPPLTGGQGPEQNQRPVVVSSDGVRAEAAAVVKESAGVAAEDGAGQEGTDTANATPQLSGKKKRGRI